MRVHTSRFCAIALITLIMTMVAAAASGQAQQVTQRRVRLLLPAEFPKPDARAVVVRYASDQKGDVVVLDAKTLTPESFAAAVGVLRDLRKAEPRPTNDVVATVSGFANLRQMDEGRRGRIARLLALLKSQAMARLGNLGPGQWVDLPESAISS